MGACAIQARSGMECPAASPPPNLIPAHLQPIFSKHSLEHRITSWFCILVLSVFFPCQRRERTRSVRNANRHPLLPVLDIKGNIQKVLVLAALVQLRFDLLLNLFFLSFQGFGQDKVEGKANL